MVIFVTIQSNNNVQSVGPTGIESVKKAGTIFKPVDPGELLAKAVKMGFTEIGREENLLPNDKTFFTIELIHK